MKKADFYGKLLVIFFQFILSSLLFIEPAVAGDEYNYDESAFYYRPEGSFIEVVVLHVNLDSNSVRKAERLTLHNGEEGLFIYLKPGAAEQLDDTVSLFGAARVSISILGQVIYSGMQAAGIEEKILVGPLEPQLIDGFLADLADGPVGGIGADYGVQ